MNFCAERGCALCRLAQVVLEQVLSFWRSTIKEGALDDASTKPTASGSRAQTPASPSSTTSLINMRQRPILIQQHTRARDENEQCAVGGSHLSCCPQLAIPRDENPFRSLVA
jgi:hypothetical protein